jgi:methylmalonyl-CoA/ethylmalonyl-CoA epimerase
MIGKLNHVAIAVPDLAAAAPTCQEVLGDGEPKIGPHGNPVLFLHPKDFNGALVELEQA